MRVVIAHEARVSSREICRLTGLDRRTSWAGVGSAAAVCEIVPDMVMTSMGSDAKARRRAFAQLGGTASNVCAGRRSASICTRRSGSSG